MRAAITILLLLMSAPAVAKDPPPAAKPSSVAAVTSGDVVLQKAALDELNSADAATIPASLAPKLLDIATSNDSTEVRESALQLLGHIGPRAYSKRAQRLLVSYLDLRSKAPPGRIRGWAAWALGKIGAPVKEVGLVLLGMTGPHDDFTRAAALEGFVELGGDVPGFLRVAMAASEPSHLRATMIQLLASFTEEEGGLTSSEATRMLARAHRTEREPLVFVIARGTPATEAGARQLAQLLTASSGYFERRIVLKKIESLGRVAAPAAPAICQLLRDPDASIFALSDALIAIGPDSQTACAAVALRARFASERAYTVAETAAHLGQPGVALLVWGLKHESADVRSASLIAIADMKPPPIAAFSDVRRLTRDPTPHLAPAAITALAAYGPRAERDLVQLFRTGTSDARSTAASFLEVEHWALLFAAIDDTDERVRGAVRRRLSALARNPEKVIPHFFDGHRFNHDVPELVKPFGAAGVPVVVGLLKSQRSETREAAAYTLGALRLLPERSVRALELALDDEDEDTRMRAAWSLGRFGPQAHAAAPSLRSALLDPSYRVREYTAKALGEVGATNAEADLIELLASEGTEAAVRVGAVEGLAALGTPGARAALIDALAHDSDYVRGKAAAGLGRFPPTEDTRVALRALLEDEDRDVRLDAARSLREVGDERDQLRAASVIEKDGGLRFIEMPDL